MLPHVYHHEVPHVKANRKFLNGNNDEAVSPVIAVILMVAITVVLAATVYVWVSGFGGSSGTPAKTISLSSSSALSSGAKSYAVASATSGMKWSDVTVTVDGVSRAIDTTGDCTSSPPNPSGSTVYLACGGTTRQATTDVIDAGDMLYFEGLSAGQTLRILDAQANSVIYTLSIG